jgi:hypothetical protein
MRIAWSLVVAWCMVVATTTHGTREDAHHAGIAAAAAFHHPLRHRDLSTLTPFVAPARVAIVVPPRPLDVAASSVLALGIAVAAILPVARGPPVG